MIRRISVCFAAALALTFGVAACQKRDLDIKPTSAEAARPAASGTSGASGMRLDPSKVVLTWSGGQMTYGELHKMKEGTFKKLFVKYQNDLYGAEQEEL